MDSGAPLHCTSGHNVSGNLGMSTGGNKPYAANFYLSGDFLSPTFRAQSYLLAKDIVNYVCHHDHATLAPNKTSLIMRSLVDDTLRNKLDMMCHLVTSLDVKEREQLELVDNIATNMFDDDMVNWGRIVTLCSFCGYLARYCEERLLPDCADDVARILGNIIVNRLGLWIVANGGWVTFENQFPANDMWETGGVWKGLAILALLVGGLFAFYSSVRVMGG